MDWSPLANIPEFSPKHTIVEYPKFISKIEPYMHYDALPLVEYFQVTLYTGAKVIIGINLNMLESHTEEDIQNIIFEEAAKYMAAHKIPAPPNSFSTSVVVENISWKHNNQKMQTTGILELDDGRKFSRTFDDEAFESMGKEQAAQFLVETVAQAINGEVSLSYTKSDQAKIVIEPKESHKKFNKIMDHLNGVGYFQYFDQIQPWDEYEHYKNFQNKNTNHSLAAKVSPTMKSLIPSLDYDVSCPGKEECGGTIMALFEMIIHLNDMHRWTREEVADWLETLDLDLSFKAVENDIS
jgi:hypothetical protein